MSMSKKKKNKSLIWSIMILCVVIVVLTAIAVGLNGVLTIKSISTLSYNTYEDAKNDGYQSEIKSQVESTISILQSEYDQYKAGDKTEKEAMNDAKEIIRNMRYREDASGYFWIDDTDYNLVMHPILPEQEGDNRKNLEDKNGVMIVQEIMKVCKSKDKGGFNEFYFTKADGVTVAPKLAYSQIFEPWGWVVSTGNYTDDMLLEMKEVRKSIDDKYDSSLIRVDIVFVVVSAAAIAVAFFFGRKIVRPLKKIQVFANHIAEGDLTTEVVVQQNNEIGRVAQALGIAQQNIRGLLSDIENVSQNVTSALHEFANSFHQMQNSISEVSTAVDSIANNVTEQAASTNDASQEVDIIGHRIETTGSEVNILDSNAQEMKQLSERSMDTLNHLIEVNTKTREDIDAMHAQTERTNQSVQQIQMAANLINEISDQTSLLALNASIEAARAGELGKGFAVVAGEISKLAQQSANSVEEIRHILEELFENASKSVEVMGDMRDSVDQQVTSLSETQNIFSLLYKELDNCATSVKSIDSMTTEIDNQRSNVTNSLNVLNGLAQDNAAVAQETAAMSVELSKLVEDSDKMVVSLENSVDTLVNNLHKFKV